MDQMPIPCHKADRSIDITRDHCPMTYVRVRLALDRMNSGQILLVSLSGDEPRRNVPRTALDQGHTILSVTEGPDGNETLRIRKK
jgi:tRNA 2-thiouridine synthesizing protein A